MTEKSDTKASEQTSQNVYQGIAKVQALLAKDGIVKNRQNTEQRYQFRGIDDVYNTLSGILVEAKLCILPRCLSREQFTRTTKSNTLLNVAVVDAEFDFVSTDDGTKHTVRTFGEAQDSADKATNKAMSAAYKYACMQAFCIPTEGDNDADGTTHEETVKSEFETDELRQKFVKNCVESIQNCSTVEELRTIKELDLAKWNAMKASQSASDVEAFNAIIAEYNPKYQQFKDAAAKAKPQTVDAAMGAANG